MKSSFFSKYAIWLLGLAVITLSSCSVSKYSRINSYNETTDLQIVQQNTPGTYIETPKNASAADDKLIAEKMAEEKKTVAGKDEISNTKQPKNTVRLKKTVNTAVNKTAKNIKVLLPDTRKLVQTAAKDWKPNKGSVHITLKDLLFLAVLIALLALLGGILHNFVGISFTLAMIIAIAVGFLVVWLYIWFNNNETYK